MKRKIVFWLCVLLVLPMVLLGCNSNKNGDAVTTPESTPISTTPSDNPPTGTPVESDEELYNRAIALLEEKKIEEAYAIFLTIKDYADVSEYLSRFSYKYTTKVLTSSRVSTNLECVSTTVYNQYGNPLFDASYYPNSDSFFVYGFKYDTNENLVSCASKSNNWQREILYQYDEYNRPIRRTSPEGISEIEYDARGNVIKRVTSYGSILEYEYDSNNKLLKITYTDELGTVSYVQTFVYDAKGQLIKETYEDKELENPLSIVHTYTYDENGNLLVEEQVNSSGYRSVDEYQYDANGNLIKKTERTSHSTIIYIWEYDKEGNAILEKRLFGDGRISHIINKTYDEAGNLIVKQVYEDNGLYEHTHETLYEYDEHGNLLKIIGESSTTEYSGYQLYYNPYSSLTVDFLDSFIGK